MNMHAATQGLIQRTFQKWKQALKQDEGTKDTLFRRIQHNEPHFLWYNKEQAQFECILIPSPFSLYGFHVTANSYTTPHREPMTIIRVPDVFITKQDILECFVDWGIYEEVPCYVLDYVENAADPSDMLKRIRRNDPMAYTLFKEKACEVFANHIQDVAEEMVEILVQKNSI